MNSPDAIYRLGICLAATRQEIADLERNAPRSSFLGYKKQRARDIARKLKEVA